MTTPETNKHFEIIRKRTALDLERLRPYIEYGEDYDRMIADYAHDLAVFCLQDGGDDRINWALRNIDARIDYIRPQD